MSKPWRPDTDVVPLRPQRAGEQARSEWIRAQSHWRDEVKSRPLPPGAKAGLALLAAACAGFAIGLYELVGPRDAFERNPAIDWNAVDEAARR